MISYRGIATLLFGNLADKYADTFSFVRKNLPKADIKISYRVYMSIVFFSSLLALFCSLILGFLLSIYLKFSLLQKMLLLSLFPLITFLAVFAFFVIILLIELVVEKGT